MANQMRANDVATILAPAGKSLKAQMRYATSLGAKQVIILGEDELRNGTVSLKDMDTGKQRSVSQDRMLEAFKA
jgi:histidyl-tRNA synthetase